MSVTHARKTSTPVPTPLRIVIAGGPGTGKSTLLDALAAAGERCYPEVSRGLIRQQFAQGGNLVPWIDLEGFAQQCSVRMQAQLEDSTHHPRAFFDRGLPDVIGYLRHGGVTAPHELRVASTAYTPLVFFAPPWPDIYVNDRERPQLYAESVALSAHIRAAYEDCGFQIIDLIKASVAQRVKQILVHFGTRQQRAHSWDD